MLKKCVRRDKSTYIYISIFHIQTTRTNCYLCWMSCVFSRHFLLSITNIHFILQMNRFESFLKLYKTWREEKKREEKKSHQQ